jgi:hypothetical protein
MDSCKVISVIMSRDEVRSVLLTFEYCHYKNELNIPHSYKYGALNWCGDEMNMACLSIATNALPLGGPRP